MLNSLLNTEHSIYNVSSPTSMQGSSSAGEKKSQNVEIFPGLSDLKNEDSFVLSDISDSKPTNAPSDVTESCGSLASGIKTNNQEDTESCGSLASAIKNNQDNTESCGSLAFENNSMAPIIQSANTSEITSAAQTNSAQSSSPEVIAQAPTIEESGSQILNMQTYTAGNNDIKQDNCDSKSEASSDVSVQTSNEAIASNSQTSSETNASTSDISASNGSQESGALSDSMASQAGDSLAYGANYGMSAQSPMSDAQNGSWTGSFVKENTGWTGAYVEGSSSQANENNTANDTSCMASTMPTGSFGDITTSAHAIMTPEGMGVQLNNIAVGTFGMTNAISSAMAASSFGASMGAGCSASSGSTSSSSSSVAA